MTEDHKTPLPTRPSIRGAQKYDVLREAEIAAIAPASAPPAVTPQGYRKAFNLTITGYIKEGGSMEPTDKPLILDNRFLADLIFKPDYSGLRLTPTLTQLLLANVNEIMLNMQDGDDVNIAEDKKPEEAPCK